MRAQEKIIKFMEAKAKKLEELGIDPELYFNDEDRENILKWKDEEAERVWDDILESIELNNTYDLSADACPFCSFTLFFRNNCCTLCPYSDVHGVCNDDDYEEDNESDFQTIIKILEDKNISTSKVFSNAFYKKVIEEIEGK